MSEVDQEGPTKSALKKKAKEEEKLRKKAEKAAKTKEAEQARAAAEEPVGHVIPIFTRLIYSETIAGLCSRALWQTSSASISVTPQSQAD